MKEGRQLFDIVAGTSAGAINATIIVNHVLQNKMNKDNPWVGSVQKLKKFWEDISTHTFYFEDFYTRSWLKAASELRNEYVQFWKNSLSRYNENFRTQPFLLPLYYFWPDKYGNLASEEAFRRYWSFLQFSMSPLDTPNILSAVIYQPDFRFLNPFNNLLRYDNTPLVQTIRGTFGMTSRIQY